MTGGEAKVAALHGLRSSDPVFPSVPGRPATQSGLHGAFLRVQRHYRRAHPDEDLPALTVHELRHTHASLLFEAGQSVKVVQERLGHASAQVTSNTYAHLLLDAQARAASRARRAARRRLVRTAHGPGRTMKPGIPFALLRHSASPRNLDSPPGGPVPVFQLGRTIEPPARPHTSRCRAAAEAASAIRAGLNILQVQSPPRRRTTIPIHFRTSRSRARTFSYVPRGGARRASHTMAARREGPTELVTGGLTALVARSTFEMKAKSRSDRSPARTMDRRISWRTDLQEIT